MRRFIFFMVLVLCMLFAVPAFATTYTSTIMPDWNKPGMTGYGLGVDGSLNHNMDVDATINLKYGQGYTKWYSVEYKDVSNHEEFSFYGSNTDLMLGKDAGGSNCWVTLNGLPATIYSYFYSGGSVLQISTTGYSTALYGGTTGDITTYVNFKQTAYKDAFINTPTWEYDAYMSITRRDSMNSFLTNPIIYNTYFKVNKIDHNPSDAANLTPITGKLYYDGTNKLYTFWGKNTPLDVLPLLDPQLPVDVATTIPLVHLGDYSPGDRYGQLFSNPSWLDFRFEPDDTRYKILYGRFDSANLTSEHQLIHIEFNTGTGAENPVYGTVTTPATTTWSETVTTPAGTNNDLASRMTMIKNALALKAPFGWWSQITASVSTSGSDSSTWGFFWSIDDAGTQTGFNITTVTVIRDLSTLFLAGLGLWIAYGELRRWFG